MVEPSPRAPEEQHLRRVTVIADLSGRVLEITERVRELSGHIAIESQPGKGTRLAVVLPVSRESQSTE